MPKLTIDGHELEVAPNVSVIEAAERLGIEIPRYCYHPALRVVASCRMCLVEVEKAPKLLPACATACADGMVVHTDSEKVKLAREGVMELLLLHHPIDCPICDQAGECKLQDYSFEHGSGFSRQPLEAKIHRDKHKPIGPYVVLDQERCVMCSRCVRFTDDVTKTGELAVTERGAHCAIDVFPGMELNNPYSANVVDLCPVGALTNRDFRFKARVWYMTPTESVCPGCSQGCNIHLDHEADTIQRLRPRLNEKVNGHWMCDTGRFGFKYIHGDDRLTEPQLRAGGKLAPRSWNEVFDTVAKKLKDAGNSVAVLATTRLSNEDGLALKRFAGDVLKTPHVGCFGVTASDKAVDTLLMRADENPNRVGMKNLDYADAAGVLAKIREGAIKTVLVVGEARFLGDADRKALTDALAKAEFVAVQDISRTAVSDAAHAVLPTLVYAETDGTFTNHGGVLQRFKRAVHNATGPRAGWEILDNLARRTGSELGYTSAFVVIRDLLARIPAYAGITYESLTPVHGETGMAGNPGKDAFGYMGRMMGHVERKNW